MSDISRAADDLVMQGDDDPADRMLSMNRGGAMLRWDGTSETWKGRKGGREPPLSRGAPRPQSPFAARKTPSPSIEYVRSTTNDGYPLAFAPTGRLIPARPRLSVVERPSVCNPNQSIMQPRKHTGRRTEGKEKKETIGKLQKMPTPLMPLKKRRPRTFLVSHNPDRRPKEFNMSRSEEEDALSSISLRKSEGRGSQPQSSSSTCLWNLPDHSSKRDPV